LAGLVIWELLQLLPVHILAAFQIFGLLGRVTVFAVAAAQAVALAISIACALGHRPSAVPYPAEDLQIWPRYMLWTTLLLAGSYGVFGLNLFTSYPGGTDALAYHLPLAVHWLQTGSLAIPTSRAWRFSMPGNAEIGMMLLLASGKQSAVVLVNWIACAVLTVSTYLLAQRLSHGRRFVSAIVSLVLLSIPLVEFQAFSAYVDLFGAAFLAAAFALFIHRAEAAEGKPAGAMPTNRAILFLSAAACGISLGTKPVYDLYGAAYAAFGAFSLLKDAGGGRRITRSAMRSLAIMLLGLLLPSVFWFARGYQATHNPLFPMRVEFAGRVILPGYAASEITKPNFDLNFVHGRSEWLIYPWTEWKRNPGSDMSAYGEGSGLGATFASLIPIGLVFFVYRLFQRNAGGVKLRLLITLLGSSLAWWFVLHRVLRFGLPILVLVCVMMVPLIGTLVVHRRRAFQILLVGSVAATCSISTFVPFHELLGRIRTRHWTRAAYYNYPPIIDQLPVGSCILNETKTEERNFSLAGAELRNCVIPGFEAPADLSSQFLRENNIGYIAEVVPDNGQGSQFQQFALIRDQVIKADEYSLRWRIWRVKQ
jgi:hypothetical protein